MNGNPRIAIVGGGPGGLTLARILHARGITTTVFERDASATDRPQGGSLDLHADTGQYALRAAGLEREFLGIARYEDQGTRLYDRHGNLHFREEGDAADFDRPEVDRTALRQILLGFPPPGHGAVGTSVAGGRAEGRRGMRPGFRRRVDRDLQSCGGGRWVAIPRPAAGLRRRPGLPRRDLRRGRIDHVDEHHPEIANLVGRGMLFALGDNRGLLAHRDADAHVGVYVAIRVPEDWASSSGIDAARPEAAKEKLIDCFPGWSPRLLGLIREAGDRVVIRKLHALPVGHRWENREGITLLGDAAHVMSPFGGDGANLAMRDAADLALMLADSDDWRVAVREFEAVMFDRAEVAAAGANAAIAEAFADDGFEHTLHHMKARREALA